LVNTRIKTSTRPTTRKFQSVSFCINALQKTVLSVFSFKTSTHPTPKIKKWVICGKIPTVENFATKNSAEKQKMPKEKGRLASGSAPTPFSSALFSIRFM